MHDIINLVNVNGWEIFVLLFAAVCAIFIFIMEDGAPKTTSAITAFILTFICSKLYLGGIPWQPLVLVYVVWISIGIVFTFIYLKYELTFCDKEYEKYRKSELSSYKQLYIRNGDSFDQYHHEKYLKYIRGKYYNVDLKYNIILSWYCFVTMMILIYLGKVLFWVYFKIEDFISYIKSKWTFNLNIHKKIIENHTRKI